MATTTRRLATEDDLRAVPEDGQKYELVDGEIRVSPAGDRHSAVALALAARLLAFVKERHLGHVMGADAELDKQLGKLRPGNIVEIQGWLVEAVATDGWRWRGEKRSGAG